MPKRILFINFHPVDSQVVKYTAKYLVSNNYQVRFLYSEKEGIIKKLIENEGFDHKRIGSIKSGFIRRLFSSIFLEIRLILELKRFNPDIVFSPTSIYSGLACKLNNKPLISWGDTETASINLKSALPYIDTLLLPDCFYLPVTNETKEIRFKGYKELAYLHPNHFREDRNILNKLNIKSSDKIVLMRFSALKALHDIGINSVGDQKENLLYWIHKIEKHAKVFISMSEKELGSEFQKYRLNIHPSEYIHLLAHCSLYIGEGTTTASEAGILGIPWIAIRPHSLGYLQDQESNYKLGIRTDSFTIAFETALNWINDDNILEKCSIQRSKLLGDKIDVTKFLIWLIEYYPESHNIMIENPDFQNKFKS